VTIFPRSTHRFPARGTVTALIALWLTAVAAGFGATPLSAQDPPADEATRDRLEERFTEAIDSLTAKLAITEEQEPAFRSIMEESLVKRAELLEELAEVRDHGERRRSKVRAVRGLRGEFEEQQRETREALSEVLTDEQMEMLDAIAEEQRAKMREAIRERRSGDARR